jgi:DNA polymerase III subunit gamma/tau
VLGDLAEFTHFVTRLKIVPATADDVSLTEAERTRGRAFASKLSMRVLARTWQMLLKGIAEVEAAGRPLAAAEMVLVRIAYAADLPTPDEVVRSLDEARRPGGAGPASAPAARPPGGQDCADIRSEVTPRPRRALTSAAAVMEPAAAAPAPTRIASFAELLALAAEKRDVAIKSALERDVRLVRCEDGKLEVALEPGAPQTLVGDLSKKLSAWTGRRWMVAVSAEPGMPSLRAQAEARKAELKDGVRADPLVAAVLARFPGAEIVDVRSPSGASATQDEDMALNQATDAENDEP